MESKSPEVSPSVVAAIFMIQNSSVMGASLFIVHYPSVRGKWRPIACKKQPWCPPHLGKKYLSYVATSASFISAGNGQIPHKGENGQKKKRTCSDCSQTQASIASG